MDCACVRVGRLATGAARCSSVVVFSSLALCSPYGTVKRRSRPPTKTTTATTTTTTTITIAVVDYVTLATSRTGAFSRKIASNFSTTRLILVVGIHRGVRLSLSLSRKGRKGEPNDTKTPPCHKNDRPAIGLTPFHGRATTTVNSGRILFYKCHCVFLNLELTCKY